MMKLERNHYQMMFGGMLVMLSAFLMQLEYQSIYKLLPSEQYRDGYIAYSKLLYMGKWIIYGLLLLAGLLTLLRLRFSNFALTIFSLAGFFEIYANDNFYIVKTLEGFAMQAVFVASIASLAVVSLNVFKMKRIGLGEALFSTGLAVIIVYLPNALITLRF